MFNKKIIKILLKVLILMFLILCSYYSIVLAVKEGSSYMGADLNDCFFMCLDLTKYNTVEKLFLLQEQLDNDLKMEEDFSDRVVSNFKNDVFCHITFWLKTNYLKLSCVVLNVFQILALMWFQQYITLKSYCGSLLSEVDFGGYNFIIGFFGLLLVYMVKFFYYFIIDFICTGSSIYKLLRDFSLEEEWEKFKQDKELNSIEEISTISKMDDGSIEEISTISKMDDGSIVSSDKSNGGNVHDAIMKQLEKNIVEDYKNEAIIEEENNQAIIEANKKNEAIIEEENNQKKGFFTWLFSGIFNFFFGKEVPVAPSKEVPVDLSKEVPRMSSLIPSHMAARARMNLISSFLKRNDIGCSEAFVAKGILLGGKYEELDTLFREIDIIIQENIKEHQTKSVLEQFCITKFSFLILSMSHFSFLGSFKAFVFKKLQTMFFGIKKLIQFFLSFFMPTVVSTKNIMFKRITILCFKQYLRLLVKKKILVFWRCNSQVIKVRSTVLFQQMVKANFGLFYPFKNRLLNFTPMLNTIFIVILVHNFNGLLFYGFTNTAFLLQNMVISFACVVGLTLQGIGVRSYDFYKMFVPSNVPTLLIPFLFIIEIISHIAKIFSLAIRLFANMMSGHILLHILTGFILKLGKMNLLFVVLPLLLIMCIILLEYGIALLQGYVFIVLLAIYFDEQFGFAQNEKMRVMKIITIVGYIKMYLRYVFDLNFLLERPVEEKLDFMAYLNIRMKLTRTQRFHFWELTLITLVPLTSKKVKVIV